MGRGGDEGGHLDIPGARAGGSGPRGHRGGARGQGTNITCYDDRKTYQETFVPCVPLLLD